MTTIAIVPDNPQGSPAGFRAVAGEAQSRGATVGQALDALLAQLGEAEQITLVVVQPMLRTESDHKGHEDGVSSPSFC